MTRKDALTLVAEKLAFEAGHIPRLGQNESPQALAFQAGFAAACELLLPILDRLEYCSIDPRLLHPQNNAQHCAALNALGDLDAKLK